MPGHQDTLHRSYTSVGLIHYTRPINVTQELHQCWPHLLHQSYKLCIGVTPVLPEVLRLDFQLGTLLFEARGGVWDGCVLSADPRLNPCPVELQWKAGEIVETTHSKMMHLIVAWWSLSPRIQTKYNKILVSQNWNTQRAWRASTRG